MASPVGGARAAVDHLHEQDQGEQDADPDEQALGPGVAGLLVFLVHLVSSSGREARLRPLR